MTIKANYLPPSYTFFFFIFIGIVIPIIEENLNAIFITLGIFILLKLFSRYIYVVGTIKIDDWGITYNKDEYSVSWDDIKDMKLKRHGYWVGRNYRIAYKLIIKKKNNEIKEIEDIEYFLYIPHMIKYIIKWYSKIDYFK